MRTMGTFELDLKRANAIIEILRVFYSEKVKQAENLADMALRGADKQEEK